ncbi:MAG TPA: TatD family hydrolase [Anaerolineae bacterium]|nr:TatD family hydrolase [Anaerolineae bacterium]
MMLIDTHVHLQNAAYADDLHAVLERAASAGVRAAVLPGGTLAEARAAVALAERFAAEPCALYAAVGIHPTDADTLTGDALTELRDLARHPRVVAIGEIGLDYYWPGQPHRSWPCAEPSQQRKALAQQLELAADLRLPVIIHDRDAHEDTLAMLAEWVQGEPDRTGTLHAYAAGPSRLTEALALGFYIGMDGPVTYRKATGLQEVARQTPLERLLLETDGPYLPPHPHRGERNEPAYLPLIAHRIAEARALPVETLAAASTRNACRLFGLCLPETENP